MRDNFKPAGEIDFAMFATKSPSFIATSMSNLSKPFLTKVQKSGLQYEKRAQAYLINLCKGGDKFICLCNPWIMFRSKRDVSNAASFCQPDCLVISKNSTQVIIVEIKLSHTADSWKQLRQLYEPVVRHLYPNSKIALLEVCKWFDPHTNFPERYYYADNVLEAQNERLGVHIYKPRGRTRGEDLT